MAKRDYSYDVVSETGNWNVAKSFSEYKVMKPLAEISKYFIMARFGVENVEDNYNLNDEIITFNRLEALKHVHYRLIRVINDNTFGIKVKKDKKRMPELLADLIKMQPFVNEVSATIVNQRDNSSRTKINEQKFNLILNALENINREVLQCLNNSDMIYNSIEETDPDEILRKIQEDIIHGG